MKELSHTLERLTARVMDNLFNVPEALALEGALLQIANDPDVKRSYPEVLKPADEYVRARDTEDTSGREYALLELYLRIHALGSGYSGTEAVRLKNAEGIGNLPGGMFPIVAASRIISHKMTSIDLGAGNGLQGLLLQSISPHKRTIQVELSSGMIEAGKMFQRALGIGPERVKWVCGDITGQVLDAVGLIYMYRPLKPYGDGMGVYEKVAARLSALHSDVMVVSVADCLGKFLSEDFSLIYSNEFFSCYHGPVT